MTKLYKCTDENNLTRAGIYNETQWGENITNEEESFSGKTCEPGCLHAYESPILAAMLIPYHSNSIKPKLWEAEGEVLIKVGDKVGTDKLTTIKEIPMPKVTNTQRMALAILAALETSEGKDNQVFQEWTQKWLSEEDRSYDSTYKCWMVIAMATQTAMPTSTETLILTRSMMQTVTATAMATVTASRLSDTLQYAYQKTNGKINIPELAEKAMKY